ncbi:hypothetical protein RAJCM14343_2358 [Rhodococcus aetherivorans]|uniref:Uncharacterized protein n=1 Tax=Rhodococcus aetherivorans TaxID=191292 RepID=A0ABQ0YKR0_9NOCA|nr:hypothetical protein RAJCM14343_2358 [Rhodococcus aetherivorans]CCW13062.1 hypothetical protein EBESD8_36150 [Rhodococcus aetherivorans]
MGPCHGDAPDLEQTCRSPASRAYRPSESPTMQTARSAEVLRTMSRIRQNVTTPPLRSSRSRKSGAARREGPDS